MKIRYPYLAFCAVVGLYVPQAFSEVSQATSQSTETATSIDLVDGISSIYSDIDMRMRLATKPNEQVCRGDMCTSNQIFDDQVQALGQRLARSAYSVYPELKKSTPNFEFSVADKKALGSASNASGKVVIFRSVQNLDLGDVALSFLIAREMGHVIARHHKSNAKTKLLFSVLVSVLFPAVSIISASSTAAQATTATTVLTSAASTAASFVGSEVALSRIKPGQLSEADDVSISLLEHKGLSKEEMAQSLEFIVEDEKSTGWQKDLNQSIHYVRKLAGEPKETTVELESLPEAGAIAGASVDAHVEQAIQARQPNQPVQPEQKPAEQHKVVLIANESLAESRNQANKVHKKPLVKALVAKKGASKKIMAVKNKSKQVSKSKKSKKTNAKEIKKSTSKKPPKKVNKAKPN